MDAVDVLACLAARRPHGLPPGELSIREIQEHVYQLNVASKWQFLVKWIARDNHLGQNELRVTRVLRRHKLIPAPPLVFEQTMSQGSFAGWVWIQGHDLREKGRDRLPEAFAQLGQIHQPCATTIDSFHR